MKNIWWLRLSYKWCTNFILKINTDVTAFGAQISHYLIYYRNAYWIIENDCDYKATNGVMTKANKRGNTTIVKKLGRCGRKMLNGLERVWLIFDPEYTLVRKYNKNTFMSQLLSDSMKQCNKIKMKKKKMSAKPCGEAIIVPRCELGIY